MENNIKHLLESARTEIQELRRRNEILSAQIAIVDVFSAALGLRREPQGQSVDVVWMLQREIDSIEERESRIPQPVPQVRDIDPDVDF